jgi:hypothetical protein
MKGSIRRYVTLEGNSKIYEKRAHGNLLRVSQFKGSIHRLNQISIW